VDWPEIIIEGFPEPRDGEPPNLRGDIADELNDHLACAMQRELRRTDDPAAPEHAVLDRFGDPKRIARRLWWDAMKEQVMKDRIMIAAMIVSVVTCLAVGVFAWMTVQQGREANQAILAELKSLSKPAEPSEIPGDWSKVTFRCVVGDRQGRPAVGVKLSLGGAMEAQTPNKTLFKQTDSEGKVTFGPMPAGEYWWGAQFAGLAGDHVSGAQHLGFSLHESITLYPTRNQEVVVVFPSSDAFTDIAFAVDWPADLKDKGFLLYCEFNNPFGGYSPGYPGTQPDGLRLDGRVWRPAFGQVVIGSDGRIRDGWTLWPGQGMGRMGGYGMGGPASEPKTVLYKISGPAQRSGGDLAELRHAFVSGDCARYGG